MQLLKRSFKSKNSSGSRMKKFPCTVCGAMFPTEEALLAHVGDVHREEKADGQ